MIDRSTIQRVMDAADIVDVVKEFVTLRRAGVNYKGLCPFHDERTPSFVVSPAKQLCKCFSCGKGGNVVHFVMEHEQMTYPEAIKWLGKKYGIEVQEKEQSAAEKAIETTRESMFVLNEWARDYFADVLHNNVDGIAVGMSYFRQRGFRDDIIRKFQLGYALPARDALSQAALNKGFNPEYLEKTGLCYRTNDNKLLDRYHGRVIFPVHTVSGKVVAFGGRILVSDKKTAKYVNSPESDIYSKSHELYGLYLAKHAIVRQNCCYLVEGYTDVISMHQSGIENVVASSGTSLTEGQIRLLHRFTNNITVIYDGDSAGIKASLRGIDMLLAEGMNIKVLLLPDGDDPDSFARKHDAAEYKSYIDKNQVDFIRFKTNLLLSETGNDPIKRATLIQDIVKSISVIPDKIVRQMYIRESATMLNVSEQLIVSEVGKAHREKQNSRETSPEPPSETPETDSPEISTEVLRTTNEERKEETLLIRAIIRYGNLTLDVGTNEAESEQVCVTDYIAQDLTTDALEFQTPLYKRIFEEALSHCGDSEWVALTHFMAHPDSEISKLSADLGEDRYVLSQSQQQGYTPESERLTDIIPRLLNDFKNSLIRKEMNALLQELKQPGITDDRQRYTDIMQRYKELCTVEQQLAQVLGDRVVTV